MIHKSVSTTPPADFSSKTEVSVIYCTCQGRFLLLKIADQKEYGGVWSAPGGKYEKGEKPIDTALREMEEETTIKLSPTDVHFFQTFYARFPNVDFVYHVFYTNFKTLPDISLRPKEHSAYLWANASEILSLPLIPGELELIFKLYGSPLNFNR